jgi:hypothetical protein
MFNQNVGDGANLFILIIAILVGFVAGLSYLDKLKTKKEQGE